jgi:hypothetical protein
VFIIAIMTGFFWALLLANLLFPDNEAPRFSEQIIWLIVNIILGWVTYWVLAHFMHLKVVMILTGLFVLLSGFRWLGIVNGDFFSLFRHLTFGNFGRISQSYSAYFAGLAAMAQMSITGGVLKEFAGILLIHFFLAGFLLILYLFRKKLIGRKWLQTLIYVETGIYLTVIGLVIMGGDVFYFINGFEKILHI